MTILDILQPPHSHNVQPVYNRVDDHAGVRLVGRQDVFYLRVSIISMKETSINVAPPTSHCLDGQ